MKVKILKIQELKNEATISIEQAALIIGLSRTKTYEMAKAGELEVLKTGKRIRVLARPLYNRLMGSASINEVES
jgi:excisionase family DNA binding protein